MRVLVVNAGSSSLKLRMLDGDDRVSWDRDLAAVRGRAEREALGAAAAEAGRPDAVGHRVVHGGARGEVAARVDPALMAELRALTPLAPLHQPPALDAIDDLAALLPGVPAVACFDTAFHARMPDGAAVYAVPADWRAAGARRYGFHGLSHAYAARRTAEVLGAGPDALRVVTCHLGAGASLAAVHGGRSLDTTMGFTPLEGLVMATRSGTIDPGLVIWAQERLGLAPADVLDALERRSGLVALAGAGDMREVLRGAEAGEAAARLALEVYLHRLRAGIAAMAAALGGLDALAFTGGVGENAPAVRAGAADGLRFLGIALDPGRNSDADGDVELTAGGAPVRTVVVRAREDLEIARATRALLGS